MVLTFLASSVVPMPSSEDFAALGEYLTSDEASGIAALLSIGEHTSRALMEVNHSRRQAAERLLRAAGLGHRDVDGSVAVLTAIAGAKRDERTFTPVWTMPGNEADQGRLTGEFHRLVSSARMSITCATYNFEPTSKMWEVLKEASDQPGVSVVVYVDGDKANTERLKLQMPSATIYRSSTLPNGKQVVSHAKFVIIDRRLVLLTSANFSYSAEKRNVELGLLVDDSTLAASIEYMMTSKQGTLYELT
jgi:phosphatidylserine/phosphatidylglycerophosphate/cardiolipin synthase-like enzyme